MGHGTEGKGSRPCRPRAQPIRRAQFAQTRCHCPADTSDCTAHRWRHTLSPELIAARDAEQKRRAQIKADAARPKFQQPSVMDLEAIAAAFAARHSNPQASDYFFNSLWNRTMLDRCVAHNVAAGNIGYDSLGLEAAHKVLLDGGYYEPERRVRGTAAPREYPPYVGVEEAQAPKTLNGTVTDSQERARLRSMPLDELAKLARAGYKNPNGRTV